MSMISITMHCNPSMDGWGRVVAPALLYLAGWSCQASRTVPTEMLDAGDWALDMSE
jgi:hypothetical protein